MDAPIFETHCHLNHVQFADDLDAALERARAAGVRELLLIGYDLESSRSVVRLADPAAGRYAAVGIHPHDAAAWGTESETELRRLLSAPGVIALGEIGLDFYRDLSPREAQFPAFRAQLDLALELGLPIVVHTRESMAPTLEVLEPYARRGLRGVLHCWSGTVEEARFARELGFFLGVGGVVTYKKPGHLVDVVTEIPLAGLVLETDAPYLSPVPYRGKRNEPAYLPLIAQRVAEIRGIEVGEVCRVTRENALQLFGLEPGNV